MFVIVLKEFFSGCLCMYAHGPLMGGVLVFCLVALKVLSHLCYLFHTQDNFLSDMVFNMFYVFGRIWFNTDGYYFYVGVFGRCFYADTVD